MTSLSEHIDKSAVMTVDGREISNLYKDRREKRG